MSVLPLPVATTLPVPLPTSNFPSFADFPDHSSSAFRPTLPLLNLFRRTSLLAGRVATITPIAASSLPRASTQGVEATRPAVALPDASIIRPITHQPTVGVYPTAPPQCGAATFDQFWPKVKRGRELRLDFTTQLLCKRRRGEWVGVLPFEDILGVRVGDEVDWVISKKAYAPPALPPGVFVPPSSTDLRICILHLDRGKPANFCYNVSNPGDFVQWYVALRFIVTHQQPLITATIQRTYAQVLAARVWMNQSAYTLTNTQALAGLKIWGATPNADHAAAQLTQEATAQLVESSFCPEALRHLFRIYARTHPNRMTASEFNHFLMAEQDPELTAADRRTLFQTHSINHRFLTPTQFAGYVAAVAAAAPNPLAPALDQPMQHYYAMTSHNTYLVGRQVAGESSVDMYIFAILAGYRSVEIDVWDGEGRGSEPRVSHGFTFTSSVPFRLVLRAIRRYAFVASTYPVTLSLETRCGSESQAQMATILVEELGDDLVTAPLADEETQLPSPEALRGRFLVKNRYRAPDADDAESPPSSPVSTASSVVSTSSMRVLTGGLPIKRPGGSSITSSHSIISTLNELTIYMQGSRLATVLEPAKSSSRPPSPSEPVVAPDKSPAFTRIFSLPEYKFPRKPAKLHMLAATATTNLIRSFPRPTRFLSSNYDPLPFWVVGCQMVALNFQSADLATQLNRAMFSASGGAGYIPKPALLLTGGGDLPRRTAFTVQVLDASQFRRLRKPFSLRKTQVYIEGVEPNWELIHRRILARPSHPSPTSSATSTPDEDVTPIDDEDLVTTTTVGPLGLTCPQDSAARLHMAVGPHLPTFVRFKAIKGGQVIAAATLRTDTLSRGYRFVTLEHFNEDKYRKHPALLIKVDFAAR
ncbi:phospholipase [Tieghemiomyces parasiticus]|uniref:Phosphoinositide phospholipase C n=1 Tax=Tieghemiomyces parasiticus TaxID=78921 RepID=A0A9W8DKT1_9FUNG|nr:phospholipase [Tieghemiomyces parasiticus]